MTSRLLLLGLTVLAGGLDSGAQETILHNFRFGVSTEGYNPRAGPILSGSTLYGTTGGGGASQAGSIYKMQTDGSGFSILHSFGSGNDGAGPDGALTLVGSTLYGTALAGSGSAVIFKVETDGTGYSLMHQFTGSTSPSVDGGQPTSDLTLVGNTFYGMTAVGGTGGNGTIYRMNVDGTGYQVLYSFPANSYFSRPEGNLTYAGGKLYGGTRLGGPSVGGNIFSINLDGSGLTVVRDFSGSDGTGPIGTLVYAGGSLYGTTLNGGTTGAGVVFKMSLDGVSYQVLHTFAGGSTDPGGGINGLSLFGSTLFGLTPASGVSTISSLYRIGLDGSGYTILHLFGSGTDGRDPYGTVVGSGGMLYGTTSHGGQRDDGTVFAFSIPEPGLAAWLGPVGLVAALGRRRPARSILAGAR